MIAINRSIVALAGLVVAAVPAMASAAALVVPGGNAAVEGNGNNFAPFFLFGGLNGERIQQVYAASAFAAVPQTLSAIAFRNDGPDGVAFAANISSVQITLSTTTAGPDNLNATFASNVGTSASVVYTGSLSLSSTNGTTAVGTKTFDVVINLQTPYSYNPSAGNLLMDVRLPTGTGFTNFVTSLDYENTANDAVGRVFGAYSQPDAATGTPQTGGLVTQFTTSAPEPTMAVIGAMSLGLLARRRR